MRHPDLNWRAMSELDLETVGAIAGTVHKDFYESPEVLAERRRLYPHGAHLLELGERPAGYVLSHPWRRNSIPALNALLGAIPDDADTYYIHDLALLPLVRRMGAAGFMARVLDRHAQARGFSTMSLVAVNGSAGFWQRQGFDPMDVPELTGKLLTYEEGARYMVKRLGRKARKTTV
jgi:hypothetical protein